MDEGEVHEVSRGVSNEKRSARDELFHALSNERRRHVLTYLHANGREATVRELSEWLAARENGVSVDEVSYKQRKRTYTSLIQIHLGTLRDGGFIRYDRGRGRVELTADGRRLARVLERDLIGDDRTASDGSGTTLLERWKRRLS